MKDPNFDIVYKNNTNNNKNQQFSDNLNDNKQQNITDQILDAFIGNIYYSRNEKGRTEFVIFENQLENWLSSADIFRNELTKIKNEITFIIPIFNSESQWWEVLICNNFELCFERFDDPSVERSKISNILLTSNMFKDNIDFNSERFQSIFQYLILIYIQLTEIKIVQNHYCFKEPVVKVYPDNFSKCDTLLLAWKLSISMIKTNDSISYMNTLMCSQLNKYYWNDIEYRLKSEFNDLIKYNIESLSYINDNQSTKNTNGDNTEQNEIDFDMNDSNNCILKELSIDDDIDNCNKGKKSCKGIRNGKPYWKKIPKPNKYRSINTTKNQQRVNTKPQSIVNNTGICSVILLESCNGEDVNTTQRILYTRKKTKDKPLNNKSFSKSSTRNLINNRNDLSVWNRSKEESKSKTVMKFNKGTLSEQNQNNNSVISEVVEYSESLMSQNRNSVSKIKELRCSFRQSTNDNCNYCDWGENCCIV